WQGAKATAYQDISSFRNAARRDASALENVKLFLRGSTALNLTLVGTSRVMPPHRLSLGRKEYEVVMKVKIVTFPETKVAAITHLGSPEQEYITARNLVDWKIQNRLHNQSKYRSYGLHYTHPRKIEPSKYRVDFCLSFEGDVAKNEDGIFEKIIPSMKCALARDVGSRANNQAVKYLIEQWLPKSGEMQSDFPLIFHYVNVGPNVKKSEAITDVYLPLK
ncbi:MAG: GyrI-like domain-containing protein, partial [Desulfobacteraceae bacterium]